MVTDRMTVPEHVRKVLESGDGDLLKEGILALAQAIMEVEVSRVTGAARGERTPDTRLTSLNGHRDRRWDTRVGSIDLPIPRVRDGSYLPSLLEPRRRAERALLAVVQEAYVGGVSTRRVEEIVGALGVTGLSRSEVSRICASLDAEVEAFRSRPLDPAGYPYVWLDALYHKVRENGRVVNMATLVAIGVSATGVRSVLGVEVAATAGDEGAHWLGFLRSLLARGLVGVRLVISDAHPGLVSAIRATLLGAAWQRSSVHTRPGPVGPDSPRRGVPWQRRPIEVPRQTRAPAGWRGPHRPEGDVPRAPIDERPGWAAPSETVRVMEGQDDGGLRRARLGRAAPPGPRARFRWAHAAHAAGGA